eukprot:1083647-Prymnesium_polylepis.1
MAPLLFRHRAWSPTVHHLFTAEDRARVFALFLVGKRLAWPSDIVRCIAAQLRALPSAYEITTIARGVGGGDFTPVNEHGGVGPHAGPVAIQLDEADGIFVIIMQANSSVRHVNFDGKVTVIAGAQQEGIAGGYRDGNGSEARFCSASDIIVNRDSILVLDAFNECIRKVCRSTRAVTTLVGRPHLNTFSNPTSMAMDMHGNLFVADFDGHCIRKVDKTTCTVTTIAGTGQSGEDPSESLLEEGPALEVAITYPTCVAIDAQGCLLFACAFGVRRIDLTAEVLEVEYPFPFYVGLNMFAMDGEGTLIGSDGHGVYTVARDGISRLLAGRRDEEGHIDGTANAARFRQPAGVALDSDGSVLIADHHNDSVRKIRCTQYAIA